MVIIGLSHGHDAGATLFKDGEIIVSISDERLTRTKKNYGFFSNVIATKSIDYCLEYSNLSINDVDYFFFNTTNPKPDVLYCLKYYYNIDSDKIIYVTHHLSHAATSVFTSEFEDVVIVVSDALGEDPIYGDYGWRSFEEMGFNLVEHEDIESTFGEGWSIYHYKNGEFFNLEKKWVDSNGQFKQLKDCSIGYLYECGTEQLVGGLTIGSAGKLMGLASFADKDWVSKQERNHKIINDNLSIKGELFYPEINYNSPFQIKSNVAGLYQREQEECSHFLVEKSKKLSNSDNITVAGGSFLNCTTNSNIVKSNLFESHHFFASSDDSGISLGCALYGAYTMSSVNRKKFFSPYLGREYSREEILNELEKHNHLNYNEITDFRLLTDMVTNQIIDNKIIGWFQGRSEIGPRALGNRSILANASTPWISDYINGEIKKREWYRPFAPSVLYEYQSEIFDLDYFSPYMLLTAEVNTEWRNKIPSVTHIDNTSRYQSVTKDTNERFYDLISEFNNKTGIPLLLNTSFNGPTEPIVESPKDAISTFLEVGLDILVINDFVITR